MKNLSIVLILWIFTIGTNAQEIKTVETTSLIQIKEKFGLDSALSLSKGLPIYKIDSLTALNLLQHVYGYSFPSKTGYFFRQMAHNWKIEPVRKKTYDFAVNTLNVMQTDTANINGQVYTIDERLLIGIIIQRPDSIEEQLIKCYNYCNELAVAYKKIFPSAFKRFVDFFKYGYGPTVEAYETCHLNCSKLMATLGKLESKYYDHSKLAYHNSKIRGWRQNKDIMRFYEPYKEYESKQLLLSKNYDSLSEINYQNEPELMKILQGFSNDECWEFMLLHDTIGFLDLGCISAPLSGHGITYKIELKEKNKLVLTTVSAWIS